LGGEFTSGLGIDVRYGDKAAAGVGRDGRGVYASDTTGAE
jgi:hypothetical protein